MSTPATPFAGAAPRLSPARVIAVIATSVLVLFGVLLGGRAFIAAAGGPDVGGELDAGGGPGADRCGPPRVVRPRRFPADRAVRSMRP